MSKMLWCRRVVKEMKFYKLLIRWDAKDMEEAIAKITRYFKETDIGTLVEEDHDEL